MIARLIKFNNVYHAIMLTDKGVVKHVKFKSKEDAKIFLGDVNIKTEVLR